MTATVSRSVRGRSCVVVAEGLVGGWAEEMGIQSQPRRPEMDLNTKRKNRATGKGMEWMIRRVKKWAAYCAMPQADERRERTRQG
jgi:hypothetical protein